MTDSERRGVVRVTTWGDLLAGDVILDKNDVPWTVVNPERTLDGSGGKHVRTLLRHADGRTPIVVKPSTEPVTLVGDPGIAADGADPNWNSGLDPETNGGVVLEPEPNLCIAHDPLKPGVLCTQVEGHELPHVATGSGGRVLHRWFGDSTLDQAGAVIQDAFGEDKVELIATETTEEQRAREAATPDSPLRLPVIDHPASLRSHLYILHEFYVADVDSTLALQEHHRKQHADYPDQGTPHTHAAHEEEK